DVPDDLFHPRRCRNISRIWFEPGSLQHVLTALGEQLNDGAVETIDSGAHFIQVLARNAHCTFAPTCLLTAVHFSVSWRVNALKAAGLSRQPWRPPPPRYCRR